MRTLILDSAYQPCEIVGWQRAVTLLFRGKVEVVEEYDEEIRSVSIAIRMPAVVRLGQAIRRRRKIALSRINVMIRDGFRCQYCGVRLPAARLTLDHVLPRARGGRTTWDNLVTACAPCNRKKGPRNPQWAGMKLLTRPEKPTWLPFAMIRLELGSVPEIWRAWIHWHGSITEGG